MPGVVRSGDSNSGGGRALPGFPTVLTNGRPTMTLGRGAVTPHATCPRVKVHCAAKVAGGNPTVLVGGMPIITQGMPDTCGHARVGGSGNTFVG